MLPAEERSQCADDNNRDTQYAKSLRHSRTMCRQYQHCAERNTDCRNSIQRGRLN